MSFPADIPAPPTTVGSQPVNAREVNAKVGTVLQDFLRVQTAIGQNQDWLAGADLKAEPYLFSAQQETDIKSAISTLDAALDGIDMTFVNRVIGLV